MIEEKSRTNNFMSVNQLRFSKLFGLLILTTIFVIPLVFSKMTSGETFLIKIVGIWEIAAFLSVLLIASRFIFKIKVLSSAIILTFLLFLIYTIFSLLWCYNKYDAIQSLSSFGACFLLFYVSHNYFGHVKEIKKLFF